MPAMTAMPLRRSAFRPAILPGLLLAATALLSGCAATGIDRHVEEVGAYGRAQLGVEPRWLRDDAQRAEARATVDALLAEPLAMEDAVRIALAYSPAFQATLNEALATGASAAQAARPANPLFAFERLTRSVPGGTDVDIGRTLSFALFDLLLLPQRLRLAEHRQSQARIATSAAAIRAVSDARRAWIEAVADEQRARYAEDVYTAAEAGAELARRMRAVGNFSRLQQAREQAFQAEAAAALTRARQQALASREALVRTLGLDAGQAERLRLPAHLPKVPANAAAADTVARATFDERLDVRLARANLDATARELGLTRVTRYVDGVHVAAMRNSETGKSTQRGWEIELPLPLFDFGDARASNAEAHYLARLNQVAQVAAEAASQTREAHAAQLAAHALAHHYQAEVVPLQRAITEEMLLRYNGMLSSVFDLLAAARAQADSVTRALDAQRDFWLADTALRAALLGAPSTPPALQAATPGAAASGGGH